MAENLDHKQKMASLAEKWRTSGESIKSFALPHGIKPFYSALPGKKTKDQ